MWYYNNGLLQTPSFCWLPSFASFFLNPTHHYLILLVEIVGPLCMGFLPPWRVLLTSAFFYFVTPPNFCIPTWFSFKGIWPLFVFLITYKSRQLFSPPFFFKKQPSPRTLFICSFYSVVIVSGFLSLNKDPIFPTQLQLHICVLAFPPVLHGPGPPLLLWLWCRLSSPPPPPSFCRFSLLFHSSSPFPFSVAGSWCWANWPPPSMDRHVQSFLVLIMKWTT